jgi:hypothetical protein
MTTSDASLRQERLATNLQGVRVGRDNLFSGDRWMLVVGGTMIPLGLIVVILGWLGASDTVLVFEQMPYLLSGGILGLGLIFGGGFLYFAYWLTLLVRENRTGREELASALLRMETLLADQAAAAAAPRTKKGSVSPSLVATKTGTMIHRPDCIAVDGKTDLRSVTATTVGLTACRLCDPLGEG